MKLINAVIISSQTLFALAYKWFQVCHIFMACTSNLIYLKVYFILNMIHSFENSFFRFLLFCSNLQLSFLALVSYYNSRNL